MHIDQNKGTFTCSIIQALSDKVIRKLAVGALVWGTVRKLQPYGVFLQVRLWCFIVGARQACATPCHIWRCARLFMRCIHRQCVGDCALWLAAARTACSRLQL